MHAGDEAEAQIEDFQYEIDRSDVQNYMEYRDENIANENLNKVFSQNLQKKETGFAWRNIKRDAGNDHSGPIDIQNIVKSKKITVGFFFCWSYRETGWRIQFQARKGAELEMEVLKAF